MAADSAQKRYSLLGLGSPVPRLLPIPQGTFGADDRALLLYLYSGLAGAETYSGGWGRAFRDETDAAREARIKAERVRLGIIEPDPPDPTAVEAPGREIAGGGVTSVSPRPSGFAADALDSALALECAALHTGAYLDAEIARHFRLLEAEDDEEALFAILALARTLH